MKSISLYNQDGSLCSEAQLLLSGKPDDMSIVEWRKKFKEFKFWLTPADLKEFGRLKAKAVNVNWRAQNPEKAKAVNVNWRAQNPEKAKENNTKWRAENPEKAKENNTKWRAENPEKAKENNTKWRAENPERSASYIKNYHKQRRAKDPLYRLQHNMRVMGNRVVKQLSLGKKPACTEKWQGCTAEELKAYLESLFTEGMSWENYGEWHADHIRPVSSFAPEEWEQINHYTNLQPLWWQDNLSKSNN
jgi:hypothetical protein